MLSGPAKTIGCTALRWRLATTTCCHRWGRSSPSSHASVSLRCLSSTSMSLVKELRLKSGAPITDCKKALLASDNDTAKAMDWLREHTATKASSKVAGRETTEGLVGLAFSDDRKSAALVQVASETDFAALSAQFVQLVTDVAEATLQSGKNGVLQETEVLEAKANDKTVKELFEDAMISIRENISVASALQMQSVDGVLVGYVHRRVEGKMAGTSAAVVELVPTDSAVTTEGMAEVGKKLAMHIIASNPQFCFREEVSSEEVNKEMNFLAIELRQQGKSEELIEKIVPKKMGSYYKKVCLVEQDHMIEPEHPRIMEHLKKMGMELKQFKRFSISG